MDKFTDNDLKRLKELSEKENLSDDMSADAAIWILNSLPDFLARLEAAEFALIAAEPIIIKGANGQWTCDNAALMFFQWCKVAGK